MESVTGRALSSREPHLLSLPHRIPVMKSPNGSRCGILENVNCGSGCSHHLLALRMADIAAVTVRIDIVAVGIQYAPIRIHNAAIFVVDGAFRSGLLRRRQLGDGTIGPCILLVGGATTEASAPVRTIPTDNRIRHLRIEFTVCLLI